MQKTVPGACHGCFESAREDGSPFPLQGHFMCSAFSTAFAAEQAGHTVTTELTASGWEATIWDGPSVAVRREDSTTFVYVDCVEEITVVHNDMSARRRLGIATLGAVELLVIVARLRERGELSRLEYTAIRAALRAEARRARDRTQATWLPRSWRGRNGGTEFARAA